MKLTLPELEAAREFLTSWTVEDILAPAKPVTRKAIAKIRSNVQTQLLKARAKGLGAVAHGSSRVRP